MPTGELEFQAGDYYTRRLVADRKKARLEDLLNELIERLLQEAYADKAARAKREEEERLWREGGGEAEEVARPF